MPFNQEDAEKVATWMMTKASKLTCAGCGRKNHWKAPANFLCLLHVPYPPPTNLDLVNVQASYYLPLTCPDCGVTVFVEPAEIGL
jgi:hypothetical protein